jgi:hypothetical protein
VLERFVDAYTARSLDLLIEGLIMHRMLSTASAPHPFTREAVARVVDAATTTFRSAANAPTGGRR